MSLLFAVAGGGGGCVAGASAGLRHLIKMWRWATPLARLTDKHVCAPKKQDQNFLLVLEAKKICVTNKLKDRIEQ